MGNLSHGMIQQLNRVYFTSGILKIVPPSDAASYKLARRWLYLVLARTKIEQKVMRVKKLARVQEVIRTKS